MRVLSVDGGGYLGLATASFIQGTEHHFGKKFSESFDLFCGTSTGAIIALALAKGLNGAELVDLYKKLGSSVFGKWNWYHNTRRSLRGLFMTKYGNSDLKKAMLDVFGDSTLDDILNMHGKRVLITSFCLTTGKPRLFKTDHSPNLSLHGGYRVCDVALASSAAPIYFPLVEVTNPRNGVTETFCDGGVVANAPALLGYAEAICELQAVPADIKLLSLSTPRMDLSEATRPNQQLRRGALKWKDSLGSVLIDSNSLLSHHVLSRIVDSQPHPRPLYVRRDLLNRHGIPMDRADDQAVNELLHIGAHSASSNQGRAELAPFFQ